MQKSGPPKSWERSRNRGFVVPDHMIKKVRGQMALHCVRYFRTFPGGKGEKWAHWYLDDISFPKTCRKSVQLHKTKAIVLILYLDTSKQELFVREDVSVSVTKLRLGISPLLISSTRPHLHTLLQPWPTESTETKFPASQTRKCSKQFTKCDPDGQVFSGRKEHSHVLSLRMSCSYISTGCWALRWWRVESTEGHPGDPRPT